MIADLVLNSGDPYNVDVASDLRMETVTYPMAKATVTQVKVLEGNAVKFDEIVNTDLESEKDDFQNSLLEVVSNVSTEHDVVTCNSEPLIECEQAEKDVSVYKTTNTHKDLTETADGQFPSNPSADNISSILESSTERNEEYFEAINVLEKPEADLELNLTEFGSQAKEKDHGDVDNDLENFVDADIADDDCDFQDSMQVLIDKEEFTDALSPRNTFAENDGKEEYFDAVFNTKRSE